ncbi:MAG: efflux RND transporter periplasmic adaptor subunit [Flavobacteriales bacterium]|nr:efflux RND transporter periplasmic adaptor subunit [Flavobacteriales bacterium]
MNSPRVHLLLANAWRHGILAFGVMLAGSCTEGPKPDMTPQVSLAPVSREAVPLYKEFVGQVYGFQDIPIRARVEGYLEGLHFEEGRPVKKGQLLYTIDPKEQQAKVARTQSDLAEARIMAVNMTNELDRIQPLADINAVSKSDLDAAIANKGASEAKVDAASANLRVAEIELGYTRIHAPIDGLIGRTMAKVGEFVGRDPNPVILNTVSAIDSVRVQFFISEKDYLALAREAHQDSIQQGTRQNAKASFELVLADGSLYEHQGVFDFLDRNVDATTGSIMVQVNFPNPNGLIRPGQYAKVRVRFDVVENGVTIPQRSVREFQGRQLVYTVDGTGTVSEVSVKVGPAHNDRYLILEGLTGNEQVVVEGLQKVRDGAQVRVMEPKSEPKAP